MYSMVLMMAMTSSPEAIACHRTSCYGCTGYSSCYGCTGYTCHGCTGYTCNGCTGYSCCGFRHGCTGFKHGCTGCTGYYYYGCTGCTGYAPGVVVPGGVVPPKEMPIPAPKKEKAKETSASALITINVPTDAKITIDGAATSSTSAVRVFSTPELAVGAVYYYTFTVQTVREGKVLTATEKVAVEAGGKVELSLSPTALTIASK
jgi:uncharacterized protein (TIGR03000 family)